MSIEQLEKMISIVKTKGKKLERMQGLIHYDYRQYTVIEVDNRMVLIDGTDDSKYVYHPDTRTMEDISGKRKKNK